MRARDYPSEYRDAFERALTSPVELRFQRPSSAVAFRVELYKYRYAVRDELPKTKDHYDKLMQIQLSVQGNRLILRRKKAKHMEKLNET